MFQDLITINLDSNQCLQKAISLLTKDYKAIYEDVSKFNENQLIHSLSTL
jgi:hypothetical protein